MRNVAHSVARNVARNVMRSVARNVKRKSTRKSGHFKDGVQHSKAVLDPSRKRPLGNKQVLSFTNTVQKSDFKNNAQFLRYLAKREGVYTKTIID